MNNNQTQATRESEKQGYIAFITTPKFRVSSPDLIESFVYRNMYFLCNSFNVITTGRTYEFVEGIVRRPLEEINRSMIKLGTQFPIVDENALQRWRDTILSGFTKTMPSFPGMIHITFELVEGRLDAVIHLTDWEDKSAKPDSAVLSREANVHNVPIANDVDTAQAYVDSWNEFLSRQSPGASLFRKREKLEKPPLEDIEEGDEVIAMVAHDKMKLELCVFAVQHAEYIFDHYKYILATGTTGMWIRRFMEAVGRVPDDVERIHLCNSGPEGGDLQIAYAVVKKWCQKIIFLQDPSVSHAHDSDIRLFEQAVAARDVHVKLATNVESAKLLIFAP